MKFLRLILIGSLTLSAAAPCYGADNRWSGASWWNSLSGKQKILIGALGLMVAVEIVAVTKLVFSIREKNTAIARRKVNLLNNLVEIRKMLCIPIQENDQQTQQEAEIKQLRDIIATGFRIPVDEGTDVRTAVIKNKLYLIPLLKELGALPAAPDDNVNPFFYLLKETIEYNKPEAFKVLLNCYPISTQKLIGLIDYLGARVHINSLGNLLSNIVPIIPAQRVNDTYKFAAHGLEPQTLLWFCIANAIQDSNLADASEPSLKRNILLIQQLLAKGANPLEPNARDETVFTLLSVNFYDSDTVKVVKKQIKELLLPFIEPMITAQNKAIADADVLPPELNQLCSEYVQDPHAEKLLELIHSEDETLSLPKLENLFKAGLPDSHYTYIINKGDQHGITPLMYASSHRDHHVIKNLIERGADMTACDTRNANVFIYAASSGDPLTMSTLLNKAKKNNLCVANLLNKQTHLSQQLGGGSTPLMCAIGSGDEAPIIVQQLLNHGADKTLHDSNGLTALDYAQKLDDQNIREKIVIMLEKQPVSIANSTLDSQSVTEPAASLSLGLD